jgi:hypothetical protein
MNTLGCLPHGNCILRCGNTAVSKQLISTVREFLVNLDDAGKTTPSGELKHDSLQVALRDRPVTSSRLSSGVQHFHRTAVLHISLHVTLSHELRGLSCAETKDSCERSSDDLGGNGRGLLYKRTPNIASIMNEIA